MFSLLLKIYISIIIILWAFKKISYKTVVVILLMIICFLLSSCTSIYFNRTKVMLKEDGYQKIYRLKDTIVEKVYFTLYKGKVYKFQFDAIDTSEYIIKGFTYYDIINKDMEYEITDTLEVIK